MNIFSAFEIPLYGLTVPFPEMVVLLTLNTIFLLFRSVKLTLLTNFLFTMYWGFIFSKDKLFSLVEYSEYLISLYIGLGVITVLCIISAPIRTDERTRPRRF